MNNNSALGYGDNTLEAIQEAIQTVKFAPNGVGWVAVMNGLLIQGGLVNVAGGAAAVVPFNVGYEKQVLGVFVTPVAAAPKTFSIDIINSANFTLRNSAVANDYFWWAIGV